MTIGPLVGQMAKRLSVRAAEALSSGRHTVNQLGNRQGMDRGGEPGTGEAWPRRGPTAQALDPRGMVWVMEEPSIWGTGIVSQGGKPGDLAAARHIVGTALPGDASHEDARARILAFIDAHLDALQRSCAVGHLTGSALVIDPAERRLLLLFHAKMRRWLQPGGHADGDGDLAHVSLREASEESGIVGLRVVTPAIDLDVHVFHHALGKEPDHLHLDLRHLVIAPAGARAVHNHESEGAAWVTLDELPGFDPEPGLVRMARAGLGLLDRLDPGWLVESAVE